jgi:HEAT repeat protein
MLKFEFARMKNPEGPSWAHRDPAWRLNDLPSLDMSALWKRQWAWLLNAPANDAGQGAAAERMLADLEHADPRRRLQAINAAASSPASARAALGRLALLVEDEIDPISLDAAYAMASAGSEATGALIQVILAHDGPHVPEREAYEIPVDFVVNEERIARAATYGLVEVGSAAVPALMALLANGQARARKLAVFALGEIAATSGAVEAALVSATRDPEPTVRLMAVEGLGWKPATKSTVAALTQALGDAEADVRFCAAFSLAQLGPDAAAAVPALKRSLKDLNRYVPGYAVEALERIGSPQAMKALLPFLKSARWCPMTTPASIY